MCIQTMSSLDLPSYKQILYLHVNSLLNYVTQSIDIHSARIKDKSIRGPPDVAL